jgi:hypothetical protein
MTTMGSESMKKIIISTVVCLVTTMANAELVQQFKDPTFSGNGWSTQVLTLEQMRQSAQQQKDAKIAADKAAADSVAASTPLAKFMSLFTGQVYSQLATQLTNNLFNSCTASPTNACSNGSFMVTETQQIQWVKAGGSVTLQVFDGKKDGSGNFVANSAYTQQIVVPISSFAF